MRLEILPADAGLDGKHEMVTLVRKKVSIEERRPRKRSSTSRTATSRARSA